jgi:hypothetical protein
MTDTVFNPAPDAGAAAERHDVLTYLRGAVERCDIAENRAGATVLLGAAAVIAAGRHRAEKPPVITLPYYGMPGQKPLSPEQSEFVLSVAADPDFVRMRLESAGANILRANKAEREAAIARDRADSAARLLAEFQTRAGRAEEAERSLLIKVAELQLAADRVRPDAGPSALAEAALAAAEAIAGGDPEAMAAARTRLLSAIADGGW